LVIWPARLRGILNPEYKKKQKTNFHKFDKFQAPWFRPLLSKLLYSCLVGRSEPAEENKNAKQRIFAGFSAAGTA